MLALIGQYDAKYDPRLELRITLMDPEADLYSPTVCQSNFLERDCHIVRGCKAAQDVG
jgi:hypothetical protein